MKGREGRNDSEGRMRRRRWGRVVADDRRECSSRVAVIHGANKKKPRRRKNRGIAKRDVSGNRHQNKKLLSPRTTTGNFPRDPRSAARRKRKSRRTSHVSRLTREKTVDPTSSIKEEARRLTDKKQEGCCCLLLSSLHQVVSGKTILCLLETRGRSPSLPLCGEANQVLLP